MPRRNTRSNKGKKSNYSLDAFCSPSPPKRSRPPLRVPKPSAATLRSGRCTTGDGDAVSYKGVSNHKFNVAEITRQVNGNIETQFVQRVLDEMFMPPNKTMLTQRKRKGRTARNGSASGYSARSFRRSARAAKRASYVRTAWQWEDVNGACVGK